jgi:hypothetical protein
VGYFTLIVRSFGGMRISNCSHFSSDKGEWWSLPQKECAKPGETEKKYFPIVSFLDKGFFADLKEAVIIAIHDYKKKELNENKQDSPSADAFYNKSSSPWD